MINVVKCPPTFGILGSHMRNNYFRTYSLVFLIKLRETNVQFCKLNERTLTSSVNIIYRLYASMNSLCSSLCDSFSNHTASEFRQIRRRERS